MTNAAFPHATGPEVWIGEELASDHAYVLSAKQARDLAEVARRFEPDAATFAQVNFRELLPSLAPLMSDVSRMLVAGRGAALVRGVPVGDLDESQCAVACWALGVFVGQGVSQSSAGDLIGYVRDDNHPIRSYLNRSKLRYHVDLADLVGLLCVRKAKVGGQSMVASSLALHNEMAKAHPEYLEALEGAFHWSRNNEQGVDEAPFSQPIPMFTREGGQVSCRFASSMIRRGAEAADTKLTPLQEEALDFMESTAARFAYASYLEPGDLQLLNNYTTLHNRTEFEDWPQPGCKRLLLRLWLRYDGIRNFGTHQQRMRNEPLIYDRQGRTPRELCDLASADSISSTNEETHK